MAHPDFDALLNALLPFAHRMLQKHGEFYPFGAGMSFDGKVQMAASATGEEQPSSPDLIKLIEAGLRDHAGKGKIRAMGICLDVRIVPPGQREKCDAVCVRLEHREGDSVEVYQPYKKENSGNWTYGDLFACAGQRRVFNDVGTGRG